MSPALGSDRRARAVVIAAATGAVAIACGSLSTQMLLWNDSTAFLASALQTARTGNLTLLAGTNAGYVALLSMWVAHAVSFAWLVVAQQLAYAAGAVALTWVLLHAGLGLWAVLAGALVAAYPGMLIYANLMTSESLYTLLVTLSAAALAAMALERRYWPAGAASAVFAGFAAATKAQGIPVALAVCVLAMLFAWQAGRRAVVATALAVACAALVLGFAQERRTASADPVATLFGAKTLFCVHLDLVVDNPPSSAPPAVMQRAAHDLAQGRGSLPVLGFDPDACQFDRGMDDALVSATGSTGAAAGWYGRAFTGAVLADPLGYARKVARQLAYGLAFSVPPHGVGDTQASVPDRVATARQLLERSGLPQQMLASGMEVRAPLLAHGGRAAVIAFRLLSVLAAIGLVASSAAFVISRSWRSAPAARACIAYAAIWFAQVAGVALTHTLDIWRYLAPVVPCAVAVLALSACHALGRR